MNKAERLKETILKELERCGFVKKQSGRYDYYRQDPEAGELGLIFDIGECADKRTIGATFFMMFSNPHQALQAGFHCNGHSGKYNYHAISNEDSIKQTFCQFSTQRV